MPFQYFHDKIQVAYMTDVGDNKNNLQLTSFNAHSLNRSMHTKQSSRTDQLDFSASESGRD